MPLYSPFPGFATDAQARAKTDPSLAISPANLAGLSAFKANKNGVDQTGIADATETLATWSTEIYDRAGDFAANAWTPPAGAVQLTACLRLSGTIAAGALVFAAIKKDGVTIASSVPIYSSLGSGVAASERLIVSVSDLASGANVYTVYVSVDVTAGTATLSGNVASTYFWGNQI